MRHFTKCPAWAFKLFAGLCYSQVLEQLPENVAYQQPDPPSFIYNGHLFAFIPSRSLVGEHAFADPVCN